MMIYQWDIYVNGKFKGVTAAMTEQQAIKSFYMVAGSASGYSGIGLNQITAKRSK